MSVLPRTAIVFGNCQAPQLARLLARSSAFAARYQCEPIRGVHALPLEDADRVLAAVSRAELFIYQEVGDSYGPYATSKLLALLPDNAQTISIPVCYFVGYNPELTNLRVRGRNVAVPGFSPFGMHDLNLLRLFSNGHEVQDAIEEIVSRAANHAFYLSVVAESIANLRRREADLDVKVSDFVQNNWQLQHLFFTLNHPSASVLSHIANQIMDYLELPQLTPSDIAAFGEPLSNTRIPIYARWATNLLFDAPTSVQFDKRHLPLQEYVAEVLDFYRANRDNVDQCLDDFRQGTDKRLRAFSSGVFLS